MTLTPSLAPAALAALMPCWFQPKSVPGSGVIIAIDVICAAYAAEHSSDATDMTAACLNQLVNIVFFPRTSMLLTLRRIIYGLCAPVHPMEREMKAKRLVLSGLWFLTTAIYAAQHIPTARGNAGLAPFTVAVRNIGEGTLDCQVTTAHWYSVALGAVAPGAGLSTVLWKDIASGEIL